MNLFDNFTGEGRTAPTPPCNPDATDTTMDGKFPSLAMVYSPPQEFARMYTPEEGLKYGTMFRDLHLPFEAYLWEGK